MGTNNVNYVGYGNYTEHVNPNFKANEAKTEIISPQTKVIYSTKPDEFIKINKNVKIEDKKGMSFGAKAASIVAGTALIAGTIYFAIRKGRVAKLKNLPEHINFTKAKTYEEAIEFGKKTFGIKNYRGFEAKDLDVLNWINEGLVNVSNAMKGKKVRVPKRVVYSSDTSAGKWLAAIKSNLYSHELHVNKDYFRNIDDNIITEINKFDFSNPELINKIKSGTMPFEKKLLWLISCRNINNALSRLVKFPDSVFYEMVNNKKLMEKAQKIGINIDIKAFENLPSRREKHFFVEELLKKLGYKVKVEKPNIMDTIYHEMGHLQDTIYRVSPADLFESAKEYPKLLKEWLSNNKNLCTASKVSGYATTGPGEFIAETFAGLISGTKYPKDVIDLYKSLKGPMLPCIL